MFKFRSNQSWQSMYYQNDADTLVYEEPFLNIKLCVLWILDISQ